MLVSINLSKSKRDERPDREQTRTLVTVQLRAAGADSYCVKTVLAQVGIADAGRVGHALREMSLERYQREGLARLRVTRRRLIVAD